VSPASTIGYAGRFTGRAWHRPEMCRKQFNGISARIDRIVAPFTLKNEPFARGVRIGGRTVVEAVHDHDQVECVTSLVK
jgi:hypothetical protein